MQWNTDRAAVVNKWRFDHSCSIECLSSLRLILKCKWVKKQILSASTVVETRVRACACVKPYHNASRAVCTWVSAATNHFIWPLKCFQSLFGWPSLLPPQPLSLFPCRLNVKTDRIASRNWLTTSSASLSTPSLPKLSTTVWNCTLPWSTLSSGQDWKVSRNSLCRDVCKVLSFTQKAVVVAAHDFRPFLAYLLFKIIQNFH